jgi:hypothetical protein
MRVPLNVSAANPGPPRFTCKGIDPGEIIAAVSSRRVPMMSAGAGLTL